MRRAPLLLGVLALAACKRADMYTQDKYFSWDRDNFFPKQQSMLKPVPGTVARAEVDLPVAQPQTITQAMVERGHQRFDIFCTPCHGRSGDGHGMIVQRGFPQPPSFDSPRLRQAKAALYYDTITNGHGAMYSYADRVPPADRWAITAYIRALQLSQDAQVASLPEQDRAQLGAGP
jgi:mono/diheme cytochrome c family protein